jgi:hypothetical protein
MRRRTTTVICGVGFPPGRLQAVADAGSNVAFEAPPSLAEDVLARSQAAWSLMDAARRRSSIYTLTDLDPLEPVVRAWAARLTGEEHDLETAIGLVRDEPVPDYYLVASDLEGDVVHWYLDHVYRLADRRVVPVATTVSAILRTVGRLPRGPELPLAPKLAEAARDYVPPPAATVITSPS